MSEEKLIFEKSAPGRRASTFPTLDVPALADSWLPASARRGTALGLPEVSEQDLVRHYTRLSQRNIGIDTQIYPLGSCTMKYNPKVNEDVAGRDGFRNIHPLQPDDTAQGALEVLWEMERWLSEVSGMPAISLQPSAGAQGELTALLVCKAYHDSKGRRPRVVLVPDSSHGTNPASASYCGYTVETVKSKADGTVDLDDLKPKITADVACLMMTNPNTVGIFEKDIRQVAEWLHAVDAQLYYDGANLNAIVGLARPGDMGCDMMHFNVHKTFSTPHGGGGPGAGPIGVKEHLRAFLPVPRVRKAADGTFSLDEGEPQSIGRIRSNTGNFGILLRGLVYLKSFGGDGMAEIAKRAVLNANYLLALLKDRFNAPYGDRCMHEFVLSVSEQKKSKDVSATDFAKGLADLGYHAPTIYFPLIVPEALMIEPVETEAKETLDELARVLIELDHEDPAKLHAAPVNTPVGRLDEVGAARNPILRWKPA
ncbi:MAG TPA: aminomethyl-transferring glycine dehydrogenase subunit GcvPB [bacterium]|nr:aminomethyl-transferring glycine dehydrogenase subunit GcvPB [bacterium]